MHNITTTTTATTTTNFPIEEADFQYLVVSLLVTAAMRAAEQHGYSGTETQVSKFIMDHLRYAPFRKDNY